MLGFLQKRWFLIALAVLIGAGLTIGMRSPHGLAREINGRINPSVTTAMVLFLMGFSLDSRQLRRAFGAPGPVLWGSLVNLGFVPLLAWPLMGLQSSDDLAVGLMIAASVPSTLAAASVWTRKAGGNDAVSLLVTLVTNGLCFLVTPLWLRAATEHDVALDAGQMMLRLLTAVLVPTLAGQLAQQVGPLGALSRRFKIPLGVAAQLLLLTLVFHAGCQGGRTIATSGASLQAGGLLLVWGTGVAVHVAAMLVAWHGGRLLRFERDDRVAITFAGSQKTLPVALLLATDPTMYGSPALPFVVFPMLLYHASQLFLDTAVADALLRGRPQG